MSRKTRVGLVVYLAIGATVFTLLLVCIFPWSLANALGLIELPWFAGRKILIVGETRLIILAGLAGVVGGFLHAIMSVSKYWGVRKLGQDWAIWYFFRPPVGGLLALAIYLVVRAGFMPLPQAGTNQAKSDAKGAAIANTKAWEGGPDAAKPTAPPKGAPPTPEGPKGVTGGEPPKPEAEPKAATTKTAAAPPGSTKSDSPAEPDVPLNPFAVVAVGMLVGLCNAQAQNKLQQVGATFFGSSESRDHWDADDGDDLEITDFAPDPLPNGGVGQKLIIRGRGFAPNCEVYIGKKKLVVTVTAPGTQLTCELPAANPPNPPERIDRGEAPLVVLNPGPPPRTSPSFAIRVS